jgi:predicted AlkP superfamily phosphohydrolase/phosphomutase
MDDILKTLERRIEVLLHLYDHQQWDLFVGVITETDRLQHFFMDAAADSSHKYHSAFRDFYKRVDGFLGQVAERLAADETLMIMSDHGFTPLHRQVYLNRWLVDNGYLKLKENARSIEDIAQGSKAFALDPGRIYINLKGRYPAGEVEANDVRKIVAEIKQGIAEISDGGKTVIKRIFGREEIYSGPCFAAAPDLCVLSNYGYDLKGAVNKQELMDREVFTGMHTQDDATLFINKPRSALRPDKPHINDVAPTVLDSLGLSAHQAMDGRSLLSKS